MTSLRFIEMSEIKYLQQAEDKANELIQKFHVKHPPVPVHNIAKKIGRANCSYHFFGA
jgi:hypothetical protein